MITGGVLWDDGILFLERETWGPCPRSKDYESVSKVNGHCEVMQEMNAGAELMVDLGVTIAQAVALWRVHYITPERTTVARKRSLGSPLPVALWSDTRSPVSCAPLLTLSVLVVDWIPKSPQKARPPGKRGCKTASRGLAAPDSQIGNPVQEIV